MLATGKEETVLEQGKESFYFVLFLLKETDGFVQDRCQRRKPFDSI